ncbi:LPS export ABC transporter ATP-binding protein [Candidatus Ozemobacteraceae bacterium]|nr:LPS export ABC transporter ATP-binding protein [Candidatus Ozemobacteraceae bacterium]
MKHTQTPPPTSDTDPVDVSRDSAVHSATSAPKAESRASETAPTPDGRDEIRACNICKSYGGRKVVDDVSFYIRKGEIVGLLGPNGAGKTTSFYMVTGLVKPDAGVIQYNNRDISQMPMYRRARRGIGYLPQEASVFRKLTVRQNIWLILENIDIPQVERQRRFDYLIQELHIHKIVDSIGYALSGGERRRVEIARALAAEPSFILLDEPFAGVDPIAVQDIQSIVLQLQRKGLGLLITDHNVRETLAIVDRAYIMNLGRILVSGTASYVANDETARKFYLGERFQLDQIEKERPQQ